MAKRIRIRGMKGFVGRAVARLVQAWMATLRYEVVYRDPTIDPVRQIGGPRIYLIWHEHMLAPIYLRPHCGMTILVSRHRDADVLEAIAAESGLECVRGSTNRGGARALKALTARGQSRHVVITPDGPRGPRRRVAPGSVFLASKLGLPIVPIAVAYDRCWQTPTWDRFGVPLPFTKARLIVGEEYLVPRELGREQLEARRQQVEAEALALTREAEDWATTRRQRPDAVKARREQPREPHRPAETRRRLAA